MSSLMDIQSQIEKLQKQASDIRSREFDSTVQDILAKMQAFGITVKDLQGGKRRGTKVRGRVAAKAKAPVTGRRAGAAKKAGASKAGAVVAPKYRGPAGETWSGRGLMPRWLSALVANGQTKEDFAIKP